MLLVYASNGRQRHLMTCQTGKCLQLTSAPQNVSRGEDTSCIYLMGMPNACYVAGEHDMGRIWVNREHGRRTRSLKTEPNDVTISKAMTLPCPAVTMHDNSLTKLTSKLSTKCVLYEFVLTMCRDSADKHKFQR